MKFINELLGFAVLTSPLWLILLLLPVAIWIAVIVAKRFSGFGRKLGIGILVFVLVLFIPLVDEIAGRIYLTRLCATQAGVKVIGVVKLPAEYWNARGEPTFFTDRGYLDHEFWISRIDESNARVESYSSLLGIEKHTTKVDDKVHHKPLGKVTTFLHWGGWIRRNVTIGNSATSCQFTNDPSFSREFYGKLFVPVESTK